jgi:LmbE family N-acetylglucosaminyl deacetylase
MTDEFYVPQRALVVVAHADDIEFGMAGTVARWTDAGAAVTYCVVTDNSSGSNHVDADLNALITTRQQEQIASAKAVGVTDVRFLGYRDGTLQHTLELRRDITRIIREIRPQVVATMDPTMVFSPDNNYINHPDHRAACEAAVYATFPSAETRPIFPELLAEGLEPHKVSKLYLNFSTESNLIVDITDVWERKVAALLCHPSQISEDSIEFIAKYSEEMGKEHGVKHAEVFRVMTLNEGPATESVEVPPAVSEAE